jgi:predicted PurR-regulated permease PerM
MDHTLRPNGCRAEETAKGFTLMNDGQAPDNGDQINFDRLVVVTEDRDVRMRQVGLTLAIVLSALWTASEFFAPLAWAVVIAIAEWPLYRRAAHQWPGRSYLIAIGFTLITALFVIGPLSLAAISLAQESQAAMAWLQHAQRSGISMPVWLPHLPLIGARASNYWQQHIGNPQAANVLLGSLSAGSILGWTRSIGAEVARESGLFIITLIALVTLLVRGHAISILAVDAAQQMFGDFGRSFVERMTQAVRATVNGTVLVSVLEGGLIGIGYAVAGVPQPLLFATFTIVLALVPFGAWAAFGLASLILISGGHVLAGLVLLGFGVAVMTIGDNFVQPMVIGSAVELPFVMAMIGAFGGLAQFGLVGLFVGPVIMAALLLVSRQWVRAAPAQAA